MDNDCDGVDDDDVGDITWYLDADGDGWGDTGSPSVNCLQPDGYVLKNADCDDSKDTIHPNADDIPENGVDEDCDGADDRADPTSDTADTADFDHDGWTAREGDCDDDDATVHPGATETQDLVDHNCDGYPDTTGRLRVLGCATVSTDWFSWALLVLVPLFWRRRGPDTSLKERAAASLPCPNPTSPPSCPSSSRPFAWASSLAVAGPYRRCTSWPGQR